MHKPKMAVVALWALTWSAEPAAPARGEPLAAPTSARSATDGVVKQITLTGVVALDERRLARISARPSGKSRIEKFCVAAGERLKRDEAVAELYSPDPAVTAQSFLDARRGDNRELERVARDRLALWGVDDGQIHRMVLAGKAINRVTVRSPVGGHVIRKYRIEGEYVEEGAALYDVADLSTDWVEADVKDQADVPFLTDKFPVHVTAKAVPTGGFGGEVDGLFQDGDTRALKVRFTVKNPRLELRPGMLAGVLLNVPAAPPEEKKDGKLTGLLKERVVALRALAEQSTKDYQGGKVPFDRVHQAAQALLLARLELCESDRERIMVLEEGVALAKEYEKVTTQRYKSGAGPASDPLQATAGRLQAEIALERARAK